ncbi:hypothetical protein BH09MYX1_BH09MYX1_32100 [soil metagenome]
MTFIRCASCLRHVKVTATACPFCAAAVLSKPRARGKNPIALAAGIAAMGVGLGCAYGLPPDDYNRDASKPDVSVNDGAKDAPLDALHDAPFDVKPDSPIDGSTEGGVTDANVDAEDAGG